MIKAPHLHRRKYALEQQTARSSARKFFGMITCIFSRPNNDATISLPTKHTERKPSKKAKVGSLTLSFRACKISGCARVWLHIVAPPATTHGKEGLTDDLATAPIWLWVQTNRSSPQTTLSESPSYVAHDHVDHFHNVRTDCTCDVAHSRL